MDDFVIARNPDPGSTLSYVVRAPVAGAPVVLNVKDSRPCTAKIYCHASTDWPHAPEVVERVAVRACRCRSVAIDLTLERGRENRSQSVAAPTTKDVRAWALSEGADVPAGGRLRPDISAVYPTVQEH